MKSDKYQFDEKSKYLNLLILKADLIVSNNLLLQPIVKLSQLHEHFRVTRSVFLTLNNVKDSSNRIGIRKPSEFVSKTRALRKKLEFVNHFRNIGVGHLDESLLRRAAQWMPFIFHESIKEDENQKLLLTEKAVIESCINSFIDESGSQKIFGHEIDLFYPPDADVFFKYVSEIVTEAIDWIDAALAILRENIRHHTSEETLELSAIAGQTSFNLKEDASYSYSIEEHQETLKSALKKLQDDGVKPEMIEYFKSRFEI